MKFATIGDLKSLVDKLVSEGLEDAVLGLDNEYGVRLDISDNIKYSVVVNTQLNYTSVDILR